MIFLMLLAGTSSYSAEADDWAGAGADFEEEAAEEDEDEAGAEGL